MCLHRIKQEGIVLEEVACHVELATVESVEGSKRQHVTMLGVLTRGTIFLQHVDTEPPASRRQHLTVHRAHIEGFMSQQTLPHIGEGRKVTGSLDAKLLAPIRPAFAQLLQSVIKIPESEASRRFRGGSVFGHHRSLKEDYLPAAMVNATDLPQASDLRALRV